jgi:tetratricopeptide (TPR) repeat protein
VALLILASLGQGGANPTSQLVWHAGVLALVMLELVRGLRTGPSWRPLWLPSVFLGLFFLLAWIGAFLAPYGYAAWLFVLDLGSFMAVAWMAARHGPVLLERLVLPLLVVASMQSIWFMAQRFVLGQARPAGSFLNPNHLAAWLVAILLLAWSEPLLRRRIEASRRWLLPALSAPALAAIALIGSRGAILGLLAGGCTLLVLAWSSLNRTWRRALIVGGMVLVLLPTAGVAIRLRQPDPFRYQRVSIWRASLQIAMDQPWVGSGPRQFPYAARTYQFADGDGPLQYDRGFRSTHSDWIRVPCELGWPGAVAVAAIVASVGLALFRRRTTLTPTECGAIAALAALGIQAAVENLSARPAVYLLAAALLGPLVARRDDRFVPWPRAARVLAGAVLLLVFVVGDAAPYLAWRDARGLPDGHLEDSHESRLARALVRNPVHPEYWRRWGEHLADDEAAWNRELYADAREAVERAIRLHPTGAMNHRALARIEAAGCKTLFGDVATRQRASAAYETAEGLEPYNPFLPLERAGFLLDTGDPRGAMLAAQRALDLEPESISPRLLLAAAVLAVDGSAGRDRAERLLEQAHVQAERWGTWEGTGGYADELLRLDPLDEARLRRALSALPPGATN